MSFSLGSAFGKISIDVSGVTAAKQRANKALGSMQRGFLDVAGPVAVATAAVDVFTRVIGKVGASIKSLAEGMVGGNTQFEQYETSFKVLLGNAELATARLEELADFGARTPFELPGVVEADRVLQSFGLHAPATTEHFKKMGFDIRTLTGDVSAGVGAGFKEIALNIGKFSAGATGEAIARFQELGIVTRDQLRAMGVEFDKSGALTSPLPAAMDAVLTIMQDKYGGMMAAQSATMGGMLSNLVDWKDNTLRQLGEPIFEVLKEKLQGVLTLLDSSATKGSLEQFTTLLRNTLNIVMDFVGSFSSGAGIEHFVESFAGGLQKVNFFLTELRDRLRSFTASDIMTELAGSIEAVQSRLAQSLSDLESNYNTTITQINAQIENAATKLASQIADITEKYGAQAAKVSQRFAEVQEQVARQLAEAKINLEEQVAQKRQALQEKLAGMERQFAEKRRAINEQIQDKLVAFDEKREAIKERLEDKLDGLTEKHEAGRAKLIKELNEATTDEERAEIQARIEAEDAEFKKQADKFKAKAKKEEDRAKKKHERALKKLKDRLTREEKAYKDQVRREKKRAGQEEKRLQQQYDRQVNKLNQRLADEDAKRQQQLAKIFSERDAELAKAQETHAQQVALLNERLEAERTAYEQNRADIVAATEAEIAALEQQAAARAQAVGQEASGAMGQVLAVVDGIKGAIDSLRPAFDFIKAHWESIKNALIAIGAVLAGAGIVAAIAAIAGVVSALASPLGLLLAGVALLAAAWTENWGGIQEKTQAVMAVVWPKLQEAWAWIRDTAIPGLQDLYGYFKENLTPILQEFSDTALQAMWDKGQEVWTWIRDTAIPTIREWAAIFEENLKPHLESVWAKLNEFSTDIQPKLQAAWDKLLEVWAAVSELYESQLKPALAGLAEKLGLNDEKAGAFFAVLGHIVGLLLEAKIDQILTGITLAVDLLAFAFDRGAAAIRGANRVMAKFKSIWDGIARKIDDATGAIKRFTPSVAGIKFPSMLTPGSPTPFENGLRGINDALQKVSAAAKGISLPNMPPLGNIAAVTSSVPLPVPAVAGSTTSNSNTLTVNGPLVAITVPEGSDAKEIGQESSNKVQSMLRSMGLK